MSTDAILNQSEPNVILTAHATKVNRTEPNWTEPQTCLACQNHAFSIYTVEIDEWGVYVRLSDITYRLRTTISCAMLTNRQTNSQREMKMQL